MEAEKSHNLMSVSWRPRKARAIIQSKSEGLRTREAESENPSLMAGESETRCPSSSSEARKKG